MHILGIDPGSHVCGCAVIGDGPGQTPTVLFLSAIRLTGTLPVRLNSLYDALTEVCERFQPEEVAVEQVFVHVNPKSAVQLGQADADDLL